jgi:glycolate oxidase
MQTSIKSTLIDIVGDSCFFDDVESLSHAASDYTEDFVFLPEAVVFPETAEQISRILRLCTTHNIPVYTRGAGTGLSGACLPVKGGLVIATQKLNRILNIDLENFQVTVEPGVINAILKKELQVLGFNYPPDPASMGSSFIGGNIAHGAGGPKAVKYGTTRDYVLNLEVVLPTGEIIWTGSNTLKNATGFSLTHLMIGSEGMLGVITKAVLKIIPFNTKELLVLASFSDAQHAATTVNNILKEGFDVSVIEFMERSGVDLVLKHKSANFPQDEKDQCYLLIALEGKNVEELYAMAESMYPFLESQGALNVYVPNNSEMQEEWWSVRRSMGELIKLHSIYKEEDTVVPRSKLPELLKIVKEIGLEYGFESICYGHAGDGNLHINILKGNLTEEQWTQELPKGISAIFKYCHSVNGTLSGEHGIGYVQGAYLDIVLSEVHLSLMKGIKKVFDPKGILNPGKWLD